jgi:hypothetical protein
MDSQELPAVDKVFELITPPLTPLQTTAFDLYQRGLNVFPVPKPHEVQAWAAEDPANRIATSKPPYILKPLFTSRMHLCGPECRQPRGGLDCLPESESFDALFYQANLAVMMGRTSGNLLHIDCDSFKAFEQVGDELSRRGLPFWAFTSHRGGGYLLRLAEGEAANTSKDKGNIPDVEIWGNSHYALLPPSFHPLGTVYQWKTPEPYYHLPAGEPPPLVHLDDLGFLKVELRVKQKPRWEEPELYGLPEWTMHLSRANRKILVSAFVEGERNLNLTKPAYDIAALIVEGEITYAEGEHVFLDAARRSDYPVKQARQMLKSAERKAPKRAREYRGGRPGSQNAWQIANNFGLAYDWGVYGRRAQTRRIVFFACVERARLDGSDVFRASNREISEAVSRTRKTVREALDDLTNNNVAPALLVFKGFSNQSGASLYSLSDLVLNDNAHADIGVCMEGRHMGSMHSYPITPPCSNSGVFTQQQNSLLPGTHAQKDLMTAIGNVSWQVWTHLQHCPESRQADIARKLTVSPSSVSRALNKLQSCGLVSFGSAEGMYYGEGLTESDIEALTVQLGTSGRSAKRKREHQCDRERRVNKQIARERQRWAQNYLNWQGNLTTG